MRRFLILRPRPYEWGQVPLVAGFIEAWTPVRIGFREKFEEAVVCE